MMKRIGLLSLASLVVAGSALAQTTDLDVTAADGAKIRATYYSPGKPGPAILLLHQCDMGRKAWADMAAALTARGVHVLSPDYRGSGDSPMAADYSKRPADIDAALAALSAQPGVDTARLAAGGASCGVDQAVELARRSGQIKALVILSGPTTDRGLEYIQTSGIPVFLAFSADEGGPLPGMKTGVSASKNPLTTIREFDHAGHGVPMFRAQPTLLPELVNWLVTVLH